MKHGDFSVGLDFHTATGRWRCTDVGARTIVAIPVEGPQAPADPSWQNGPPYALAEEVFDENDLPSCSTTAYPAMLAAPLLLGGTLTLPTAPLPLAVLMGGRLHGGHPNAERISDLDVTSDRGQGVERRRPLRILNAPGGKTVVEVFHHGREQVEQCPEDTWRRLPLHTHVDEVQGFS